MLDDVLELTNRQRRKLISLATTVRTPTKVWLAERLEALSSDEWFSEGRKKAETKKRSISKTTGESTVQI
jgi:hypothetical protein